MAALLPPHCIVPPQRLPITFRKTWPLGLSRYRKKARYAFLG
ncbi:hypothetical protein ACFL26_00570 [Patescibacteria group bacterium]